MKTPNPISHRIAAARDICASLHQAAVRHRNPKERHEIFALIQRIALCNSRKNYWQTNEAVNYSTGELYEAYGQYWNCGSKLCPTCVAKKASDSRRRLRTAIAKSTLARGERWSFITLTIPKPNTDLMTCRAVVNRAWSLLRKKQFWVSSFRAGSKSEEFTVSPSGYHYHLHLLTINKWFLFQELRRQWTECVDIAFREQNIEFDPATKDGLLWVKIIPVRNLEKVIFEVAKYVTKSDSWLKISPSALIEIALVHRWNRMFELLGDFRETKAKPDEPIVHKRPLSDGGKPSAIIYWRDRVAEIGDVEYVRELHLQFLESRSFRLEQLKHRWPHAVIADLAV